MGGATWETIWMTVVSMIVVAILGVLLGLLLFETTASDNVGVKVLNAVVSFLVNVFRSIPFIILIMLLLPITKNLVGTIIGPTAALPSLIVSAAPFYARMVELAFHEIDRGVIEAAEAMGANKWQIVYKVLLPESMPALVSGVTVTTISLIGYTAMAGAIGAGGLGNLAYIDGFQANNNTIVLVATVIIVVIVFAFQFIGDFLVRRIDKRTL
ncbi:ABC transporter permease [Lactobacillus sp. LC28-10]|uniref:ABC transporter permease n=1 Tax=Secundilactobacillus angelensis TaxID=2722706 RepID=A0ABX1KYY1_9LACO|nr:methionine ABC transporter permease [Secundilactobacillus angelensis]MCH5462089.1 ABC transporter permease [Secundilactobacillus angelensis]NLR18430.1 ABC transporter permease [Secundilactobacillus angelensis]